MAKKSGAKKWTAGSGFRRNARREDFSEARRSHGLNTDETRIQEGLSRTDADGDKQQECQPQRARRSQRKNSKTLRFERLTSVGRKKNTNNR
jgi:hypothetical protein